MASLKSMADLKKALCEDVTPFFTDEQLEFYAAQCSGDYDKAAYKCLVVKSENFALQMPGLSTGDTSRYFLRLARMYRPKHSGFLEG